MGSKSPKSDQAKNGEIGEQQRCQGRRAVNKVIERASGRAMQIGRGVQQETPDTDDRFEQKNPDAQTEKFAGNLGDQRNEQEPHGKRSGNHRHPFHVVEEAVRGMVCERKNEIAEESAKGEQEHPLCPFPRVSIEHAIDDQQEAKAGVGQGGGEWSRMGEAANGAVLSGAYALGLWTEPLVRPGNKPCR